ncbi:MAG: polysaccharide deacetylase family protein [bacterium]
MSQRRIVAQPALPALLGLLTGLLLIGCGTRRVADMDEVYFSWDQRRVLCGVSIDDNLPGDFVPDLENLREGFERARARGEVLVLYAHEPGDNVSLDRLESVLALVDELGLPFLTFDELHGSPRGTGVALTFDDAYVDAWHEQRALFAAYGARVTFFVTRFHRLSAPRLDLLRELRADGHAIESHGANHVHAPDYVEEYGLQAYVEDEVLPSLEAMRREGFTPTTFAYPSGVRTSEIDRAVLKHVALVRSISWATRASVIDDPCPE